MVCLGDTYHIETSHLFCDADRIEWNLSEKIQLSESTYNSYPPRFPLLVALQVLIEVFANGSTH